MESGADAPLHPKSPFDVPLRGQYAQSLLIRETNVFNLTNKH